MHIKVLNLNFVIQLFIDSFIATGWASKYERANELRAKYATELEELAKMDAEAGPAPDNEAITNAAENIRSMSKQNLLALSNETRDAEDDDRVGLLSNTKS